MLLDITKEATWVLDYSILNMFILYVGTIVIRFALSAMMVRLFHNVEIVVDSNFDRIRSWSIIKSKANISFLHFVSAFFSDTIRVFISKLTRAKVENGKTVC